MRNSPRQPRHASSTPIYDRRQKHGFLKSLAKTILFPLVVYLAVLIFGVPALRFQGQYFGPNERRQHLWCDFLTIHGIKRIVPPPGINQRECELIRFFPAF